MCCVDGGKCREETGVRSGVDGRERRMGVRGRGRGSGRRVDEGGSRGGVDDLEGGLEDFGGGLHSRGILGGLDGRDKRDDL